MSPNAALFTLPIFHAIVSQRASQDFSDHRLRQLGAKLNA